MKAIEPASGSATRRESSRSTFLRAVRDFYDSASGVYDGFYHDALSEAENRLIGERLARMCISDCCAPVVDLGCGRGLGYSLREWGSYVGVDISLGMLQGAVEAYPCGQWILADAEHLPFQSDSVPGVVSTFGALSHTWSASAAVAEAHRVLTPGGHALFMVYSRWSLRNMARSATGDRKATATTTDYRLRRSAHLDPVPARQFSSTELRELAQGAGFTNVSVVGMSAVTECLAELNLLPRRAALPLVRLELVALRSLPDLGHSLICTATKA